MRFALLTMTLAGLPAALHAQADAEVRLIAHEQVSAAFAKGSPLIESGEYKIHASRREGPGVAEIHTRDTDIAYVLQGSATLVTGGRTRRLGPGDVVVIPNGVPHWFKQVEAPFVYYVVKVREAM